MRNPRKGRCFGLMVVLMGGMLLSACAPALPRQQAERELVSFMLRYVLLHEPGSTYPEPAGGHYWADAPADASLVVWAPPASPLPRDSIALLKSDQPIKAWWFAKRQLVEVLDKENAIQQFRQAKFSVPFPNDNGGSYYEFGILSLSSGNRQAQVYADYWCGPLCGAGSVYTLQRNAAGQWEVTGSEMKWIS